MWKFLQCCAVSNFRSNICENTIHTFVQTVFSIFGRIPIQYLTATDNMRLCRLVALADAFCIIKIEMRNLFDCGSRVNNLAELSFRQHCNWHCLLWCCECEPGMCAARTIAALRSLMMFVSVCLLPIGFTFSPFACESVLRWHATLHAIRIPGILRRWQRIEFLSMLMECHFHVICGQLSGCYRCKCWTIWIGWSTTLRWQSRAKLIAIFNRSMFKPQNHWIFNWKFSAITR